MAQEEKSAGPLAGLKVLDLSRFIAGPQCGMILADLGADVVKVERPKRGDDVRAIHPQIEGESIYFMVYNRNKRGMTLDFRNLKAQDLLRDLVKEADILIENFRPGTMERMGCGWDELHAINPRLIMARVSGFGQNNSMAQEPCFDGIAQARSGLMEITGTPDGPPTMSGSFIVDYSTSFYASIGILAALQHRHGTGEGQLVDVSLMGSALSLLMTAIPEAKLLGNSISRIGNRDRYSAPAQTFRAKDGRWVHLIAGNAALFPRFAAMIGRPELLEDPRFCDHASRMKNQADVEKLVSDWMATMDSDEAVETLRKADVPAAKIATIEEVVNDPYVNEAGHIVDVPHETVGTFPMQGLPIRLSESPGSIRRGAPVLGGDTAEVLKDWLGRDAEAVDALRADGVL
ncbi:CoA:oxalate CoA-transferase [Faunimonas pinastri]|uniref:CoA:oxalate CoA-transferase n=1 Tax=Faunimonas pinastri TaxID=1855383 RepID=A0A1H9ELA8_9HYPH|nr:CoA transferase [Faunimonas pinastri]SEQ26425.1 CoA:oxalate CoA-transferase [Faunimonas pinastri]